MKEKKRCQSCAMPVDANGFAYGTNADGGKNTDYCIYCLKDGKFRLDINMEEMIFFSVPELIFSDAGTAKEVVSLEVRRIFSSLKRWRT